MSCTNTLWTICQKQGTDKTINLEFKQDWLPLDITGYEVYFILRKKNTIADTNNDNADLFLNWILTDTAGGKAKVDITNVLSATVPVWSYESEISYKAPWDIRSSHYWYWVYIFEYLSNKDFS